MRRGAEGRHRSGRGIGRERERKGRESVGDAGFFNDDRLVVLQRGQIDMSQVQMRCGGPPLSYYAGRP